MSQQQQRQISAPPRPAYPQTSNDARFSSRAVPPHVLPPPASNMVATQAVEPEVREMTVEQLMKMNGLTLANSAESHHADIVITENTMAEAHPAETRTTKRSRVDDDAEDVENLAAP